jgi:hypothetical protein
VRKFYRALFTFSAHHMFVEYGDPSIASHSIWSVPGTWED